VRLLAQGEPVSVQQLAQALTRPAGYLDDTLDQAPGVFRDDARRITGFLGLKVVDMGEHRLHLLGRSLWTWCAWDTLYLPELLGETARVSSRCPTSGREISLTVTPSRPADLTPAETVGSFLAPETPFDANILNSFCRYVHFFASPDAAAPWLTEHTGTVQLTVDDAHRIGRLTNHARFGAALEATSRAD
jgi:alkylmercury lyase